MTTSAEVREQVRRRAHRACEFCGVSETDVGGQLTVDHFRPRSQGGTDSLDNLLYCCGPCNQYKLDYWPTDPGSPRLWNPRHEPAGEHFVELEDGTLHPLTSVGAFTLRRLRLNRPPLVALRLHKRQEADALRLLTRYRDLTQALSQLLTQQAALMEEQQALLEEQRGLLRRFLGGEG
ncbi:MAG: HNH endonuclease [Planctomycetes bacterium]|nr:HNH endonuclease [Planctomycetota bacterium]MBM4079992.1 HNH endonuclease [Planctomycetota bacterium]MBM4084490.1 HNH endonuclease [Planctomycetota bacterium]